MQSVMKHQFSQVPQITVPRSSFDRTHGHKTTFQIDKLVPIFVDEVLPGDTFNLKQSLFCRLATPIVPIMDNMFMDTFYFFVPNRLLWKEAGPGTGSWEKFNGAQENPGDSIDFLIPRLTCPPTVGFTWHETLDYMGVPPGVENLEINALHTRAYNLIYNEWFKDQNLQNNGVVDTGDGPDDPADYHLNTRNKKHDYFTSCLPWPQKGDAVEISLGTSAPVIGDGNALGFEGGIGQKAGLFVNDPTVGGVNPSFNANELYYNEPIGHTGIPGLDLGQDQGIGVTTISGESGLIADLSSATAATVNDLREAFQIQKLLEKDARGGTRYVEILKNHFGVTSPDFRLQRPEYLGGSSTRINISPVQQTSASPGTPSPGDTPQGNLAGFGIGQTQKGGFSKSFVEHGVIIGMINVRADLTYQKGVDRMWSRQTRYDFYWPSFAHLGEQAVLKKEIYAGKPTDDDVFGYQERYAEYRYKNSVISSKMRSDWTTPLDFWHLSQDFGDDVPSLNEAFMRSDTPIERAIAIETEPHFILDTYFQLKCARAMPVYSVPGLIDHF